MLNQIKAWGKGDGEGCIFWLNGVAGTGKSTIARTVARTFDKEQLLGASFFFSRGKEGVGDATAFFTTLAIQLTEALPDLKPEVCDAISRNGDIAQRPADMQWKELILHPLSKLDQSLLQSFSLVLVIDALDECEPEENRVTIVQLLSEVKNLQMIRVRVFLTSRLETSIHRSFIELPEIIHFDLMLHSVPESVVQDDISKYLTHELGAIGKARLSNVDWPGKEAIQKLVQKADRLFVYAATACRFLNDSKFPKRCLDIMLQATSATQSYTKELDKMYTLILGHLVAEDHDEENQLMEQLFKRIVGSIVTAFDTHSVPTLCRLLKVEPDDMNPILKPLHSVLIIPEHEESPIQLFHHSFREFLFDKARCSDEKFQVDEVRAHTSLVQACIQTMSRLDKDMCGLMWPGTLATEVNADRIQCLLPELKYACRYWIDHLQKSDMPLVDDGKVHKFLCAHLLHWLEVLSLMGKMSEAVLAIIALDSLVEVITAHNCLAEFLTDLSLRLAKARVSLSLFMMRNVSLCTTDL